MPWSSVLSITCAIQAWCLFGTCLSSFIFQRLNVNCWCQTLWIWQRQPSDIIVIYSPPPFSSTVCGDENLIHVWNIGIQLCPFFDLMLVRLVIVALFFLRSFIQSLSGGQQPPREFPPPNTTDRKPHQNLLNFTKTPQNGGSRITLLKC